MLGKTSETIETNLCPNTNHRDNWTTALSATSSLSFNTSRDSSTPWAAHSNG